MKVCLLNDSFPPIIDGVANTVANYARILTEDRLADVIVGTPGYPNVDYNVYPYPVVPYKSIDVKALVEGYRVGNPMAARAVGKLEDFQPDIIHAHCPAASMMMARMMRHDLQVPIVFTYHTKFDVDIAKAIKSKSIQAETLKAIVSNVSACDEVWVVSKGAGDNLVSLGYEGEYRIMTNGVDFPKGRADDAAVGAATAGYDLPVGVPVFLFVGRIMKYKGLPIIVDALNILNRKNIDFRMVFVGDGADRAEIAGKVTEYGLDDKVFFTGPISDREVLRAWNTRADLFLFPSTYDTNGIVVREAAACGLGSVLIKDSCAAEGITDGRNGYLVEENAESMAALLEKIAPNLDAMHMVGNTAMEEIYISWDQSVRNANERYREIIDLKLRNGLTNRKRQANDVLFALGSEWLDGAQRMFGHYEELHNDFENIRSNINAVQDELTIVRNDARDNVDNEKDQMRDNWNGHIEELRRDFKDNMDELSSGIKDNFTEWRDGMMDNFHEFKEEMSAKLERLEEHIEEKWRL